MLSDDEVREIEAVLPQVPQRQAACIDALLTVQRHRGWVSDDALADVAAFLDMAVDELEAVATFYNGIFRKPVNRHVIRVCDSISCWVMGCDEVREALKARLRIDFGANTADGRFTLLPNVCLGACDHAPVLMVDDDLHGHVDAAAIVRILEDYR